MNDSPKGLIDRQVTLEIKALLRSTDLSIKEIAYRLNFEDSSYLTRYFKKQTGMTLTQYRN
ncbi:helix-turn-helix domain-containing protein [Sphingobacterium sp. ML3W]|uniref:helix-turn-helix domain-containing protein n=1 Tax=Sphingobacterium sp. ML3W TaxID=1538644 RepID=UPI00384AF44C